MDKLQPLAMEYFCSMQCPSLETSEKMLGVAHGPSKTLGLAKF